MLKMTMNAFGCNLRKKKLNLLCVYYNIGNILRIIIDCYTLLRITIYYYMFMLYNYYKD